jgi:hypothetical protein
VIVCFSNTETNAVASGTALIVNGDASISGHLTAGTVSITNQLKLLGGVSGLTAAHVGAVAITDPIYLAALTNATAFENAGAAARVQANLVSASNALNTVAVSALAVANSKLSPTGSGAQLTGITAAQVGAVSTSQAITINGVQGTFNSNLVFNSPDLQQVINAGNTATGIGDLTIAGRIVNGSGLDVANIAATSYGAQQAGWNNGTMTIGADATGAQQAGVNHSTMTIGEYAYGAQQAGWNYGTMTIGGSAIGAQQAGRNYGTMKIGTFAYGSQQRGTVASTAAATNDAIGALQLFDLSSGQSATITASGSASIGLGACVVSHKNSIVAGDGQQSHGVGTVTANGFYVGANPVLTNVPTLQAVVTAGATATGIGDLTITGRVVNGIGLEVASIAATALGARQSGLDEGHMTIGAGGYGAQQAGHNTSFMTIGAGAEGAQQMGFNFYNMTIGLGASGAQQAGYNMRDMSIGQYAFGAQQSGYNAGTMTIGPDAIGAQQRGSVRSASASALNYGVGAIQLIDLTSGQSALITPGGDASLSLGACVVYDKNSIVAGDDQESHGDGSITAGGGFYGSGANLTGITAEQVGAVATNAPRYLLALTNAAAFDPANAAAAVQAQLPAIADTATNALAVANTKLSANGSGAQLTGITAAQVGALTPGQATNLVMAALLYIPPMGDLSMGSFTNAP